MAIICETVIHWQACRYTLYTRSLTIPSNVSLVFWLLHSGTHMIM